MIRSTVSASIDKLAAIFFPTTFSMTIDMGAQNASMLTIKSKKILLSTVRSMVSAAPNSPLE